MTNWRTKIQDIETYIIAKHGWSDTELIRFLALSLAGEAGELANEIKKEWRADGYHNWTTEEYGEYLNRTELELADVYMLLHRLGSVLHMNLEQAAQKKVDLLDLQWLAKAAGESSEIV